MVKSSLKVDLFKESDIIEEKFITKLEYSYPIPFLDRKDKVDKLVDYLE